jgi:hypothetical protein
MISLSGVNKLIQLSEWGTALRVMATGGGQALSVRDQPAFRARQ